MKKCINCDVQFETHHSNKKFCSYTCQNRCSSKRAKRKKLADKKEKQEGHHEKTWLIMNMTIKKYLDSRKHKPAYLVRKDNFSYFARAWNKDLVGLPCEICGYDKHTEIAHIKAINEFSIDTQLKLVHTRENLRVLCPNHHWEFDNLPRMTK